MQAQQGQFPGRLTGGRQVEGEAQPRGGDAGQGTRRIRPAGRRAVAKRLLVTPARSAVIYTNTLRDAHMALSIKNVEAERLARELAEERGTTVTGAIIGALEEALRRTRHRKVAPSIREAILEISDRCAALPDIDTRPADEILGYDEQGGFG